MTTANMSDPSKMTGANVYDGDGRSIGKIDAIYFDNETDKPEWVAVRTGLFGGHVSLVPATARFGARYIPSRVAAAIAGHAVLERVAEHAAAVDAVAIACFGDPGLDAARELAGIPVAGMADASLEAGLALLGSGGPKLALLTGGAEPLRSGRWPMSRLK